MNVRAATLGDAQAIAEVHVRTWQAAYRHVFPAELPDGLSVDDREAGWRSTIEGGSERVWVAADGRPIVGFACAGPSRSEQDVAELYALYVLPEAWGGGAGHALMEAVIGWFRAEEYTTAVAPRRAAAGDDARRRGGGGAVPARSRRCVSVQPEVGL